MKYVIATCDLMSEHLNCKKFGKLATIACCIACGSAVPEATYAQEQAKACGVEPTVDVVEYGDNILCSIESNGDIDRFQFRGVMGEEIQVRGTRASDDIHPCLSLFAPSDDSASIASDCDPVTQNSLGVVLSENGVYEILMSARMSGGVFHTGDYAITLERIFPRPPDAQEFQYQQSVQGEIDPVGDGDFFYFHGNSGDTVVLTGIRTSGDIHPCFALWDPTTTVIGSVCEPLFSNTMSVQLKVTGSHTVRMIARGSGGVPHTGGYELTLQCVLGSCEVGTNLESIFANQFE